MSKKISFSNEPRIWFYVNENLVSSKSSQEISEIFLLNNNFYCDSKGSKVKLLSRECLSLDGHERIGFQVTPTIRGQMDKDHFRNHCVSLFLTPGLPIFDNLKIDYCPNCYSMKPEHNYRLCNKIACLKCGEKGCPGDCCSKAAHQNCKKCLFCGCKGHSTFDMKCILFRTAILHSIDSSNFKYDKLFLHVDHLPIDQRNVENKLYRNEWFNSTSNGYSIGRIVIDVGQLRKSVFNYFQSVNEINQLSRNSS